MSHKLVFRIGDYELAEILEKGFGWSAIAFISPGSIPCNHFKAEFDTFAQAMKSALFCGEIVADEHPTMCERLGVTAVPTTVLIHERKVVHNYEGPYSYEALTKRVSDIMKATS